MECWANKHLVSLRKNLSLDSVVLMIDDVNVSPTKDCRPRYRQKKIITNMGRKGFNKEFIMD